MKVRFQRVSRLPPWPLWAVAIVSLWSLGVGFLAWRSHTTGVAVTTCLFRRLTGYPCPACGGTRGVLNLLTGDPAAAWALNPLLFTALATWAAVLVLRAVFARRVAISDISRPHRRLWLWAGIAAVLANWLYVLYYQA